MEILAVLELRGPQHCSSLLTPSLPLNIQWQEGYKTWDMLRGCWDLWGSSLTCWSQGMMLGLHWVSPVWSHPFRISPRVRLSMFCGMAGRCWRMIWNWEGLQLQLVPPEGANEQFHPDSHGPIYAFIQITLPKSQLPIEMLTLRHLCGQTAS